MDLPPLINKGHEPRGNDLEERSQEQPMKMESNKAFHRTAHKAPPVNADVRTENERCGTMLSKGTTAMRMPGFGNGNETAEQPK